MPNPEIILASRSKARVDMMNKAGLRFHSVPADIDEESVAKNFSDPQKMALELAIQKARHVSKSYPGAQVIGSDQVLECEGKIFSKARNRSEASDKLKFLRGKTHRLISAIAIVKDSQLTWSDFDEAILHMKNFDDAFLSNYLNSADEAITACVGAYALEETGAWLFDKVEGDYFTVLGMPLLKLLGFLQAQGARP